MINYPTKPQNLFTIEEITAQIQSGEYSAELLLMHLCCHYDSQEKKLSNVLAVHEGAMRMWQEDDRRFKELEGLAKEILPVFIEAADDAMSYGPSEIDPIYKEKQEKARLFLRK